MLDVARSTRPHVRGQPRADLRRHARRHQLAHGAPPRCCACTPQRYVLADAGPADAVRAAVRAPTSSIALAAAACRSASAAAGPCVLLISRRQWHAPCSSTARPLRAAHPDAGIALMMTNAQMASCLVTPPARRSPPPPELPLGSISVFFNKSRHRRGWPRWRHRRGVGAVHRRTHRTRCAAADNPVAATHMGIDVSRAHRLPRAGRGHHRAGRRTAGHQPSGFHPFVGLEYVIVGCTPAVLGGMAASGWRVLGRVHRPRGAAAVHAESRPSCRTPRSSSSPAHRLPAAGFLSLARAERT